MRLTVQIFLILIILSCGKKVVPERTTYFPKTMEIISTLPDKENVWVFIMAGQSNMAGRGIVEPKDTVVNKRIFTLNKSNDLVFAKEPLHFYEPERTGLDCGHSFAKTLLRSIPKNISILIIPTAVGGSSISQWLGDSLYRGVQLYSNFAEKVEIGKKYGMVKGILWHQGESDSNERDIPKYKQRLGILFSKFRATIGDNELPIMMGELGSFSDNNATNFNRINQELHKYASEDKGSIVISTADLKDKGDHLHFNSKGQRTMGKRFAETYLNSF